MRNRYLIANWKMNLPPEGITRYFGAVVPRDGDPKLVVAPPSLFIPDAVRVAGTVAIAAQNCSDHASGAFTGEVSPVMLRDCGVTFVIIGHSERRTHFHESDAMIARKLAIAIETGLTPVLCIGEDRRVRDAGHVERFLADQIRCAASSALEHAGEIVLAYEPIWAIGTGRNATGRQIAETIADIRDALSRSWPARYASEAPILYGGSVTPENIRDLQGHAQIDGFLVGGASLDSARFLAICECMRPA
ncbi:MAG: triose-phosphate isomerase [Thermoanaerobaculia bacterium]